MFPAHCSEGKYQVQERSPPVLPECSAVFPASSATCLLACGGFVRGGGPCLHALVLRNFLGLTGLFLPLCRQLLQLPSDVPALQKGRGEGGGEVVAKGE